MCESFNSFILEAREMPIIRMLEEMRVKMMCRIRDRGQWMRSNSVLVGPLVEEIITDRTKYSRGWKAICNGADGYEVKNSKGEQYVVYLRHKTCTCRRWQISGIPCSHAICCLNRNKEDVIAYLDACYSKELFLQLYAHVLFPINGSALWPKSGNIELDPPLSCVQPGRPKKIRRKDINEVRVVKGVHKMRRVVVIHCKKCGHSGHNSKTCKFVPNDEVCSTAAHEAKNEEQNTGNGRPKHHVSFIFFTVNYVL